MKKLLLFIFMFLISINNVYANSVEDTLNSISNKIKEIKTSKSNIQSIVSEKYPVGSIYMSTSSTNPSSLFGGTWEAFATGRTLLGVDSNGTAGQTGGSASVTLSTGNLPAHTHTYTASGSISSTFSGTTANVDTNAASHTHTLSMKRSSSEASGFGLITAWGFEGRIMVLDTGSSIGTWDASDTHGHTLTPAGSVSSTFAGTEKSTSSTGSTTAFNVLNPYITVYMWKRTA